MKKKWTEKSVQLYDDEKRAPVTKGSKCFFHDSHENICNHCVWNQFLPTYLSYDVKYILQWDHESKTGDGTLLNHFSKSREIVTYDNIPNTVLIRLKSVGDQKIRCEMTNMVVYFFSRVAIWK